MKKRILSLFMGLCLLLTLVSGNLQFVSAEEPKDITLTKDKVAGENPGEYEITLTVTGRAESQTTTKYQDVVLLLDTTSSMDSKLSDLKNALSGDKMLLDTLLSPADSTARVTIVCFSCWDSKTSGYGAQLLGTYTHNDLTTLKNSINSTTSPLIKINGDSTNIQLGLMKLSEVLDQLNSDGKSNGSPIVIEMTDGDPNQYQLAKWVTYNEPNIGTVRYKTTDGSNATGKNLDLSKLSYIKPGTVQFFNTSSYKDEFDKSTYASFVGDGASGVVPSRKYQTQGSYGPQQTSETRKITWILDNNGSSTVAQTNMTQTQALLYCAEDVKSKAGEVYTIAFGSSVNSTTKGLLQRMATDSAHAYDVKDTSKLASKFVEIATNISGFATNASVTDPMGPQVGMIYDSTLLKPYTNVLADYQAGMSNVYVSTGSVTYDAAKDTLHWTIGDIPYGATYTMKYWVKIDDGVVGTDIPLNEGTAISYKNLAGESSSEVFPVPEGEQTEATAKIEYKVVGGGTVSLDKEDVKVSTGTAAGSTATASDGYKFLGWYSDEACTDANKLSTDAKYTPVKKNGEYETATYYAKFEKQIKIDYVAVTSDGGSVSPATETIGEETGTAAGSTATEKKGYTFGGWYSDEACTDAKKLSTDAKYTPTKNEGKYEAATYYAEFTENEAEINYVASSGGTVSTAKETVKAVNGTPTGSTAAVSSASYTFVGWYSDASYADEKLVSTDAAFVPTKNDGVYETATYYAKFTENGADLTVKKSGCSDKDANQSFIFHITSVSLTDSTHAPIDMYVTVQGNGSVTVKKLPLGTYKVEEVGSWSWRYQADGAKNVTLGASGATAEIKNTRSNTSWLNANAYAVNTVDTGKKK